MKLKELITNTETSKRLFELGVPQISYFYWVKICGDFFLYNEREMMENDICSPANNLEFYSALTSSEISQYYPDLCSTAKENGKWVACGKPRIINGSNSHSDTEIECRGKLLIHLIKNGLITFNKEVKSGIERNDI